MKVRFNVEYNTIYGENLVLNIVNTANGEKLTSHVMKPASDKVWKCDLDIPAKAGHNQVRKKIHAPAGDDIAN